MYQCSGCGGNLAFDIASQRLKCQYCNTLHDPYEVTKERDGYENDTFEATYFACPQCGGEIYTTDNACAAFCSFCGASTILSSRIEREKAPKTIVPFKVSKEQCRNIYMSKVRKSLFAPRTLKNEAAIESFRGIYMPYWKYKYSVNGNMRVKAKKSHRSGDYIITDHYNLDGKVDAVYNGYTYDSSSNFYDNISEEIAPFDLGQSADFTASMLSGFYADVADVPEEVYEFEAREKATDNTISEFSGIKPFKGYETEKTNATCPVRYDGADSLLFPVWFMSYRNKDQVAYVTINGQSGKMSADIPIDNKKFLLFSLIIALPIFLFLNVLPAVIPKTLVSIIAILSVISNIIFGLELSSIRKRMENEGDKGLLYANSNEISKKDKKSANSFGLVFAIIAVVCISPFIGLANLLLSSSIITLICLVINFIIFKSSTKNIRNSHSRGTFSSILCMISLIVAFVILIIKPVADIYYYSAAILMTVSIFLMLTAIMLNYNKLVTRRPPQFNKKGGDDRAY